MGMYAQTNFCVECEDNETAKVVALKLKSLGTDENGNTFGQDVKVYDTEVGGFECSGRYQNLSYRCEKMWDAIKEIKGVVSMNCPFLSEADGEFYDQES